MKVGVRATDPSLNLELFRGYEVAAGSYDEVFSAPGVLRPEWQVFLKAARGLSRSEFLHRWEQAQRHLKQNSLAYPDLSSLTAFPRPWELDGLPLVISHEEWRGVEAALVQRAALLDEVLRDLYGPRHLIRDGIVPPEILYEHPGFRAPFCRSANDLHGHMLHFYAADLARAPDGRWWVLADRTESPSGSGFALENRVALSRMLPEVFRECHVERLAPYFIAVKERLARLSPRSEHEPHVVLLSQSAGSTNYFEDAYLARYLGYRLAESGDLAVRKNQLFLKSLAGLSPVDVLWRRPNSEHLDPLELADAGSRGTAGLLQAARSGNVAIANVPGTGLVESPIFRTFLPRLAEKLLGEPLAMPSVATWWCGEPDVREYVLERLDELIVMPIYRQRSGQASQIKQLAEMSPEEIAARINAAPRKYVAQERIVRSGAPAWTGDQLRPSYIALRAFAVAREDDYVVLPGGLVRVSTSLGPLELSLLDGERSKDAWVLSDAPVVPISLLTSSDDELLPRRGGVDLPSRAAEHFFWLGRHSVRAESIAKLLRAAARRLASEEDVNRIPELPQLLRLLAEQGQIEPGYVVEEIRKQLPALEKQLPTSAFDEVPPGALRATVASMASLASTVRDLMSLDSWRIIRQMNDEFRPSPGRNGFLELLEKLDGLLVHLSAYAGEIAESMTRTYTWMFLDLGRRLERALQESLLLRCMLSQGGAEPETLQALLEIFDSVMTYRSRYGSRFQLGVVLDLMICDESNPRSIVYQLVECAKHLIDLPGVAEESGDTVDRTLIQNLLISIRKANIIRVSREFEAGDDGPLIDLLAAVEATLPKLSDSISHRYFFHSTTIQRLAEIELKSQQKRTSGS